MPCSVSWRELIRILHLSSDAILDCLISEMAVTSVSIALAKSPGNTGYIFITGTDQHLFRTSDGRCILAKGRNGSHTHWRRVRDTAMNQQNNSGPGAGQVNTDPGSVPFHCSSLFSCNSYMVPSENQPHFLNAFKCRLGGWAVCKFGRPQEHPFQTVFTIWTSSAENFY